MNKTNRKKRLCIFLSILMLTLTLAEFPQQTQAAIRPYWYQQLDKYGKDKTVRELLMVQYEGGTKATVRYYQKNSRNIWRCTFAVRGYVGYNGIDKVCEGDGKTPTGVFTPTKAFGILKNPGTRMKYQQVNKYHYWCGDRTWYNRFVDVRKQKHVCNGEHLIDYKTYYNYCIDLGYNRKGVWKKGSALFLHCQKPGVYSTGGCVAIPEKYMKKVMTTMSGTAKIIIGKK